jgi:hypothetical protein
MSTFSTVATILKDVIETEFTPEQFTVRFDKLHESLGRQRVDIGITPTTDIVRVSDNNVQETWVEVRFYLMWKKEISPDTAVDPTTITDYAERFRVALRERAPLLDPHTGQTWFISLVEIAYPDDPTGNKTRFHATLRALGNNAAIVETTA